MSFHFRVIVCCLATSIACSEQSFTRGPSDTGGGSSGAGTDSGGMAAGGASGASGASGAGSAGEGGGGTAGDGGVTPDASGPCVDQDSCGPGHYCSAQRLCKPCSDIGSLPAVAQAEFSQPEMLPAISQPATTSGVSIRFPRAFGTGQGLLYQRSYFTHQLWLSGDATSEVGAPLASPVGDPEFSQGSVLWLRTAAGALSEFNLLFNRSGGSLANQTELVGARLGENGATSDVMRLPAPFNANLPTVQSAYSIAVSETRAWWMVNLDSSFQVRFLTAPLDGSAPPSVVTLTLPDGCVLNEFDFGPWVTPDGKLLFVNAAERDTSCASIEPRVEDILVFQLDETGQPIGPGVPLPGISRRGTTEVDASLSSDMCWLYFTAPLADGGMHGASRARRRR